MDSNQIKHNFKAETHKVLNILTHSLYTNREIFLRELLSNASDALDKLRFMQSKGEKIINSELPLEIKINIDKDNNTLSITDTGIGMTMEEMQENLGTIAKSGSEQFLKDIGEEKKENKIDPFAEEEIIEKDDTKATDASQIIGRFGIGFYSVFMVAEKIEVLSIPALESKQNSSGKAYKWESTGSDSYSIEEVENTEIKRGTVIKAYLKADAKEFLEEFRIENIIRSHSNFLPFSIFLNDKLINTTPALWREPKFSITEEQYTEFYKFLTYDQEKPFDVIHLSVDAPVQFNTLIFIPNKADDYFMEQRDNWGLDLYVKRVLIAKNCQDLIPNYFAFLKGVVDTEDMPLNISRETLQENIVLRKISQTIVRQLMSHLEKMAKNDKEKYNKFWKIHGKYFKFAFNDYVFKDRVANLMRFISSTSPEELISLEDYASRIKEGQKEVWYVSSSSKEAARLNPHLERFTKKGIEVLYLLEPIDEIALESLGKFQDLQFKNIEQSKAEDVNSFADVEDMQKDLPKLDEQDNVLFDEMLICMRQVLGDKVIDVKKSERLSSSPACMTTEDGMSSSMEKLMRSFQKDDSVPKKILEINQNHSLLRSLLEIYKKDKNSELFKDICYSVFENTVLLDGYLADPYIMAERNLKLLEKTTAWYVDLKD